MKADDEKQTENMDLVINIEKFEKLKKEAKKKYNEICFEADKNSRYIFENLTFKDIQEGIIDEDTLEISGDIITQNGEDLGFIYLCVPLDFEKMIGLFQSYIKKLTKIKTIMESVKDE